MSELQDAARRAVGARMLADVAKEYGDEARARALELMQADGIERVRVAGEDGINLGPAYLSASKATAKVVDERAFFSWVAQRYPTEIRQIVNEAWRRKFLDQVSANAGDAGGLPYDPDTAELVPGVEVRSGQPYVAVKPTEQAKQRMRDLLEHTGLLALPEANNEA
jgi:citrate lyase gamma subunit